MSDSENTQGLTCPNCGGVVPIPEGQAIVRCPYCEMRSLVRGERGLRRYQVPKQADQQVALAALRKFLSGNWAIARDAGRRSQLQESFLVYLPFWTVWSRLAAWAFGQKKVGSGDDAHYEPREVRIVQQVTWNGAACDVGEFGVERVPLGDQGLEPFDPQALHRSGMVFEPVNSFNDARLAAENQFKEQARRRAGLDRLAQLFIRFTRRRYGLLYYPLWVMRYLYRGRSFQVVVDGYSGKVLYGKAPGNTLYRAAVLVAGMALGAFVTVDASAFFLASSGNSNHGDGTIALGLLSVLFGLGILLGAYRRFRYGEHYEFRDPATKGDASGASGFSLAGLSQQGLDSISIGSIKVKDVEEWVSRLS
jgi:DNA-directed RNA polymerase subunit RPC12/RpoP